jgi:predicted transcriptional regulator
MEDKRKKQKIQILRKKISFLTSKGMSLLEAYDKLKESKGKIPK